MGSMVLNTNTVALTVDMDVEGDALNHTTISCLRLCLLFSCCQVYFEQAEALLRTTEIAFPAIPLITDGQPIKAR